MFPGGGGFGPGPGVAGMRGGGMGRLRSVLDTDDDMLGKPYDSRVISRLTRYVARVKIPLLLAVAGTLVSSFTALAMPYLVRIATDGYMKTGNFSGLNIVALGYVALALLTWAGQYVQTIELAYVGQWILLKMRADLFEHLLNLSMSFFDRTSVGKIMSRLQDDVDQLNTLLTQDSLTLAADVVTLIVIAGVMFYMNVTLALLTLTMAPVLAVILIIWLKYARRAFIRVRRTMAQVNDQLQEGISGVRVTQSLHREDVNLRQFDSVNKVNLDANVEAARLQAFMMPTVDILTNASYALVLVFGGLEVMNGQTTPGVLLAFLLYIQRFFAPVQELTVMYTELERAMASGAHIFELLDVKPDLKDSPETTELPRLTGEVKFNHVSFGYEPGVEILHDINFTVNPGQTVALAGRTGAGKSSTTSLIDRFYDVTNGEVLVDGRNVKSVTQKSLRRQIGVVPQDPFLFSGTIEENIRYGRQDATQDEVIAAGKAAGAHDFIMRLDKGYETSVGERGSGLSAGQRQLICLARAILIDPPILILDEATSNVDTNTERIMQASLRQVSKGRTCIVIAHRLSTVTDADRIIVIEHGKIIESGSHRELLAKGGLYSEMFKTLSAPGLEQAASHN
jgi:ATP-binding cassette subfamily B protein